MASLLGISYILLYLEKKSEIRFTASILVSITTSAYTCVEFMLVCPSNLPTVYKSPPAANDSVAIEWRLVWKLTFFSIPAAAAIFLRHMLQALRQVMSKTFCPDLQPLLSGTLFNADWFNGIVTCFPVFCMAWIETTNPPLVLYSSKSVRRHRSTSSCEAIKY